MSIAETAEPIDLPFRLWTRVGWRKHQFNHIRQLEPKCPISIVFARLCQCARLYSAVSCAKAAEPIDFPVWVVDSRAPKEAHVQPYSPGGAI